MLHTHVGDQVPILVDQVSEVRKLLEVASRWIVGKALLQEPLNLLVLLSRDYVLCFHSDGHEQGILVRSLSMERALPLLRHIDMNHTAVKNSRLFAGFALVPLLAAASCASATGATQGGSVGNGPTQVSQVQSSSTVTTPPTDALALCRQALSGRDVVSGTWATVADLRDWGYGGPVLKQPMIDAFPGAAPTDQAAWCWTKNAPDSFTAWGVRASDAVQLAITVNGPTSTIPSGEPRIP
jgi:hypothetical protein